MLIPKPLLTYKVLFVGSESFMGLDAPDHLNVSIIHFNYDRDTGLYNGQPADQLIINQFNKINAILVCPQPSVESMLSSDWMKEATKRNIPVGVIWYDAIVYPDWVNKISEKNFNIVIDDQKIKGENNIVAWCPIITQIKSPKENRPIDVSFLGNVDCEERCNAILYLLNNGINVFTTGNQPWNRVSYEMMYHYLRMSKITLNFSRNRWTKQFSLKGRVFEVMLSGSLLIEDENDNTPEKFIPGEDVVFFNNLPNLHDKIVKYLKDDKERVRIASNAQNKCIEKYNIKNWWQTVLPPILKKSIVIKF